MRAVPHLCELYPGICLTTEEKARKTLFHVAGILVENCSVEAVPAAWPSRSDVLNRPSFVTNALPI